MAACACGSPVRFTAIANGGVATVHGSCGDIALAISTDGVAPIRPGDAACSDADAIGVGAAGAYWQTGDTFAGPIHANAVAIEIPFVAPLDGGGRSTGERSLATGERRVGLASSETARGLDTGTAAKQLAGSEERRGLESGESTHGTRSVTAVVVPIVQLHKRADVKRLAPGGQARFVLELENASDLALRSVVVFDRVPAAFAVVGTDGTPLPLADGSTLVMWSRSSVAARRRVAFEIRVELRRG